MLANVHDVDDILANIGMGKWQMIQFWLLVLYQVSWAHATMGIIFIGFVPDFACLPPDYENNESIITNKPLNLTYGQSCEWHNDTNNITETCSGGYVYAEPQENSIVSEWDLVCGQTFLVELSQAILTVGEACGTMVFTPISDKYGRRKVVVWGHVGFLMLSLANCLADNIITFSVIRFFYGAFIVPPAMVGWVITLELFTSRQRTSKAWVANIFWGVCACVLPAVAYIMTDLSWRYFQLAMSGFSLIVIGHYFYVDEPLRWLIANGRSEDAVKVVRKACAMNGISKEKMGALVSRFFIYKEKERFPDKCRTKRLTEDASLQNPESNTQNDSPLTNDPLFWPDIDEKQTSADMRAGDNANVTTDVSVMALLRHHRIRTVFLILTLAWFTNSVTYIGLYMLSSVTAGNRFLNFFLTSFVDFFGALVMFPVVHRCRRKRILIVLHLLAAIALISSAVIHITTDGNARYITLTCLTTLGKFCISCTYNFIFLYTPEVFPTNFRSACFGFTTVASRIGGIIAPFAATVARKVPWVPAVIFGVLCLLVGMLSPLLPETKGRDLPQTLEDFEGLYSNEDTITSAERNERSEEI